jgi:hypothetical protein
LAPFIHSRRLLFLPLLAASLCLSACTAALGPGYSIESQEIQVRFEAAGEPKIRVESHYRLRNTGNQPLSSLEVRLPGHRLFTIADAQASWDGTALSSEVSPENPRDTVFQLPRAWNISEGHTLNISSEFAASADGDSQFRFTADAFFLPAEGWASELLPARGLFAKGGVPPKQWRLSVHVPREFLIHTSGKSAKRTRSGNELTVQALQTPVDRYPFVVAGAYKETSLDAGSQKIRLWTRSTIAPADLQQSLQSLSRVIQVYDQTFGNRTKRSAPFWIVQCPVVPGCFVAQNSRYAQFLGMAPGAVSAELASADTLMADLSGSVPKLAAAAPSLAASWLGYGENPGFYEQAPPLSALPAFADSLGREAVLGPSARLESIRSALGVVPRTAAGRKPENEDILRAKSFLFFFALEDRYGPQVFQHAVAHMLSARKGEGFDLDDLIAAFEQETHQNVAEFVRLWFKHPGVPGDFRERYESSASAFAITSKENRP